MDLETSAESTDIIEMSSYLACIHSYDSTSNNSNYYYI